MEVSSSPHIKDRATTNRVYLWVILALLPATGAGVYFFRTPALLVVTISVASAVVVDYMMQRISKQRIGFNGSAVITGLLLGLILPPTIPLWLPVIGAAVAVGIAKYAFGPGNAIFNPALVGRIFLAVSFPALMVGYIGVDGTTSATPLTVAKTEGYGVLLQQYETTDNLYRAQFSGNIGGSIGETSALFILIGGLFLILIRVVDWRIPLSYLGSVALMTLVFGQDLVFNLLAGGLMFGAFFMATDYVTAPITRYGRLIFGIGCGLLTVLLRVYSGYPEGVAFSILLMNAATPLIERLTKPKTFGY